MSGILMVAGEPSGDRHAAELARVLRARLPQVRLWGMGGEHMAREGVELLVDIRGLSVVGISEVLGHVGSILSARKAILREVDREAPLLGILIDFPDFNLWLARGLRGRGIPLLYYIAPQVWAWRKGRVRSMARLLDRVAAILPFEEEILRRAGIAAEYVGHPLLEQVNGMMSREDARTLLGFPPDTSILGLFPGSRPGEVNRLLPIMLRAVKLAQAEIPDMKPVVALSTLVPRDRVEGPIRECGVEVEVVTGEAHTVMRASKMAVVASGTVTLEAAMLETPILVIYRTSWITYLVGRLLATVQHVALVNVLARERIVPELLQWSATPRAVCSELLDLWGDEGACNHMIRRLRQVAASLGSRAASRRTADMVLEMLSSKGNGGS